MRRLFAIIVAAIAFVGCSMDDITVSYQTDKSDIYYASFEDFGEESRTYVDEDVKLLWHEDDRISLFRTTLNEQFKFTGATGANSGGFAAVPSDEWVTGNQVSTNYAVYPYDATTKLSNNEIIQLTMPAVQQYAENSFGRGANTMVAASENTSSKFLPFRNLGGYIIVKLYGEDTTIKSIEFKGNNEEVIAGAATAEAKYGYLPVIAMSESGTTTITLDCGEEGVTISSDSANPTSFWFVVPPITFEGGFTFTITDINGNTFTKSTTKSQTVVRNEVKSMSGFEPTFEGEGEDPEVAAKPANNEIWYTNGSTTEPTTPYKTDVFGANIVSNTYDAEKECWVIKFDGDVINIGDDAFFKESNLVNVIIPTSVTTIGYRAFGNCSKLTNFTIPDSVSTIDSHAFSGCDSLLSITIPNKVTYLSERVFESCDALTDVTIPKSVKTIGSSAFYNCASLVNIVIPNSVTKIMSSAFMSCKKLEDITIGDSVESIGDGAFYGCTSLQSITLPNSLTTLGSNVFYDCPTLSNINIPSSVISINEHAFSGSTSLNKVDIQDLSSWCKISFQTTTANPLCSGAELYLNGTKVTDLVISSDITLVSFAAFYGCSSIKSVTIGPNTTFRTRVFEDCDNLLDVTFLDGVTTIPKYMFWECKLLANVSIPNSVATIESGAFRECESLKNITLPSSVTNIGENAFRECPLLEVYCQSIVPPTLGNEYVFDYYSPGRIFYVPGNSVESYKSASYWNEYAHCIIGYNFETGEIVIPSVYPANNEIWYTNGSTTTATTPYKTDFGGATIQSNTYNSNDECWVIKFDKDITAIGYEAFKFCSNLESVYIPTSVELIDGDAFYNCSSLKEVYCMPTTPPACRYGAFPFDSTIYVPSASVSAYKSAPEYWTDYTDKIVGYDF